jgi:hypothetical protein
METLFQGQKEMSLELPESITSIQDLLFFLRENHIKGHPELFMQGNSMYQSTATILLFFEFLDDLVC